MSKVVWFTGLSGSGKTTVANELKKITDPASTVFLDGDILRGGLCSDLGFSVEDRNENIRRVGELAKLFHSAGHNVVCSFISPIKSQRDWVRSLFPVDDFFEIYMNASLDVCQDRDPKGLYAKVAAGEIKNFTGVDSPYEVPVNPETVLHVNLNPICSAIHVAHMAGIRTTDNHTAHHVFIGRFGPFHKGHLAIMERVHEDDVTGKPLLVLVRDTDFDDYTVEQRVGMVRAGLLEMGIAARVMAIPDICSVNWGRGVGYEPRCIEVEENIQGISATEIRKQIKEGDDKWRDTVVPGVAEYIDTIGE